MALRVKSKAGGRFSRKLRQHNVEPIAIVGMSCRLPSAPDLDSFARMLDHGQNARGEIPSDRFDIDEYYDPEPGNPGTIATRFGNFLDQIDQFDAGLFKLTPREVEAMDPQHRLLLELAWEAFEHAGLAPRALARSNTGVYVGISTFDYLETVDRRAPDGYTNTGLAHSAAVGRLSYIFDLKGPCQAIDTACSSSLVAVHSACQALRTREIDCALVSGVNAIASPYGFMGFSKAGMMALDGRCKTFDARADGYGRGEGCGALVLERLSEARAKGRTIHALIMSSAVNHDGRSQGLTAPNGVAQRELLARAWSQAGYGPDDIDYVEAHGTGTSLGDPQELLAIGRALAKRSPTRARAMVGSAKTNVGHLEAAAGVVGLLKLALMVSRGELAPHLNLERVNPSIDIANLPLRIPTQRRPWPSARRIAGVSSFGFSGTNAHVVVAAPEAASKLDNEGSEDASAGAPEAEPPLAPEPRVAELIPISARSDRALARLAGRWARHLHTCPSTPLAALATTAALGRQHFDRRASVVADSPARARAAFAALAEGREAPGLAAPPTFAVPKVALLFTGQGAQRAGMGRELYAREPLFRAALDRCAAGLAKQLPAPLLELMFAEDDARIHQTGWAQPALFAYAYALAELWRGFGVRPAAVLGHSVGELAAACVAGCLSLDDALTLVATRGRLMQALEPGGAMVSLRTERARAEAAIAEHGRGAVSLAAINGPAQLVISGSREPVLAVAAAIEPDPARVRELSVSHAFHSARMDPALDELERVAAGISYAAPRCSLISNLSGAAFGDGEAPDAAYWRRHAREPVDFEAGAAALRERGITAYLELGPQPHLIKLARASALAAGADDALWLASATREQPGGRALLDSLAALHAHGVDIDWAAVYRGRRQVSVPAPTYPFERRRHWIEPERSAATQRPRRKRGGHALLGARVSSPLASAQFDALLGTSEPAYLGDHRVYGLPMFPATGYIELALAALDAVGGGGPCELLELRLERAMIFAEDEPRRVQTLLTPIPASGDTDEAGATGGFRFGVFSRLLEDAELEPSAWLSHASGRVRPLASSAAPEPDADRSAREHDDPDDPEEPLAIPEYYRALSDRGIRYTGPFAAIESIRPGAHGSGRAQAAIRLPAGCSSEGYLAHPALLDVCLQTIAAALTTKFTAGGAIRMAYLPISIDRVVYHRPLGAAVTASVEVELDSNGLEYSASLEVRTEAGELAVEIAGLRMQGVERARMREARSERQDTDRILAQLAEAEPAGRFPLIAEFLTGQVAEIMGIQPEQLDASLMYFELGMSSLGSVELLYRIQKNLRVTLASTMLVDYENTETLATHLLERMYGQQGGQA